MSFNNDLNTVTAQSGQIDAGLRSHMQRIYNRMTLGVFITAAVSFYVGHNEQLLNMIFGTPLKWVVMLAPLGIVFFGFNPARMSANALRVSFVLLSALYGLSFGAIFAVFTGESIAKTFFVATSMFAGLSIFGYTTKKNLEGMGNFLVMGVWGVLILSLINIFIGNSGLSNVIAAVGIIVFAGLTAWDTQRMKEMYSPRDNEEMASRMSWVSALSLYINFIAMFQYLLHFMGNRN